jgi:uncharacterized protein (DUF2336 family)
MAENLRHLEDLIRLAEEPTSEARRAVLEGVSELFMSDDVQLNKRETGIADDILGSLAEEVEAEVRAELAERFADLPNAPHGLIRKLANDVFEVAAPVLMRSGILTDADLVEIVRNNGESHQIAVANRPEVSETVSEALVEVGTDEVLETLVRNEGASISEQSMSKIVERSETSIRLQAPLAARKDLPGDMMQEMLHFAGEAVKRIIMSRADVDEETVRRVIAKSEAALVSEAVASPALLRTAKDEIDRLVRLGKLHPDSLGDFLRRSEIPKFIVALAHLVDVDVDTARHIVFSPNYEGIAVACRAAKVEGTTFATIIQIMARSEALNIGREPLQMSELLQTYLNMPEETAQRAMRFWRVRQKTLANVSAYTAA